MANPNPTPRKAKHDIAPLVRNAFTEGLGIYARKQGKTIPEVFADWIEANPMQVLQAVGRYTVREAQVSGKIEHDHDHKHRAVSETAGFITEALGLGELGRSEEPPSH